MTSRSGVTTGPPTAAEILARLDEVPLDLLRSRRAHAEARHDDLRSVF